MKQKRMTERRTQPNPDREEKRNQTPTERMNRPKAEPTQIQIKRMNRLKEKPNKTPREK